MSKHFHLSAEGHMSITTDTDFATINADPSSHTDKIKFHSHLPNVKMILDQDLTNQTFSFDSLSTIPDQVVVDEGCFNGNSYYGVTRPGVRTTHTTYLCANTVANNVHIFMMEINGVAYPEGVIEYGPAKEWCRHLYLAWDTNGVYLAEYAFVTAGTMPAYTITGLRVLGIG